MKGTFMSKNEKATNRSAGEVFAVVLVVLFVIAVAVFGIWGSVKLFGAIKDLNNAANELFDHQTAANQISSGVIIDKEIVNGHTVNGSGGIVASPNGSGVVIGGNQEYIPTQYRLYVRGEYEVNGEVFEGEKYFDVPAEIYQAYKIGDFFDSRDPSPHTTASLCPNCGAVCDTPFCGACGASMNSED